MSLPTEYATVRMRAWRALRATGAAVLRDGVYLLPERDDCRETLTAIAADVQGGGGNTHLIRADEPDGAGYAGLFDRSADYAALLEEVRGASRELDPETAAGRAEAGAQAAQDVRGHRRDRLLRRRVAEAGGRGAAGARTGDQSRARARRAACGEQRDQAVAHRRLQAAGVGDAPAPVGRPPRLRVADPALHRPQGAIRLAGEAEGLPGEGGRLRLRRRQVQPRRRARHFRGNARELRPRSAGAQAHSASSFTTWTVGVQPPEASGTASVLAGLRDAIDDDDQLVKAAGAVFDALLVSFEAQAPTKAA